MAEKFPKIAQLRTVNDLCQRLDQLGLDLPVDDQILSAQQGTPLAEPISIGPHRLGNRWCIHPMEGWDANRDGSPSAHTLRRWRNFGISGAKLIWGGEAAAVQPGGRANPNQTLGTPDNIRGLEMLRSELVTAHASQFGNTDGLVVGLQLTHSGRFCRPDDPSTHARKIAYHHPLLDQKFGIHPQDDSGVLTDDQLEQLIDDFVAAAHVAHKVGFDFVDVKSCHGYLLHEMLSARTRPGKFGGDFAGRTRLLTTIVSRIRDELPDLTVAVRLSVFDVPPYAATRDVGRPMDYQDHLPYMFAFGAAEENPLEMDLDEPIRLIRRLADIGVAAVNVTCGSPYYNPHIQRPAIFPASDAYLPPEDPLVGVVRQIQAARQCKQAVPDLPLVGSGYTYLQQFLPQVAQAVVRSGWIDIVGIGRMVLSYPEMPAHTLAGRQPDRKRICRTFSDCTTAPRHGLVSGCFPLDPYYRSLPEAKTVHEIKQRLKREEEI